MRKETETMKDNKGIIMGYLQQIRGMSLLGCSPQYICNQLGITEQVYYRWIEKDKRRQDKICKNGNQPMVVEIIY